MTPERWRRIEELVDAARELAPNDRSHPWSEVHHQKDRALALTRRGRLDEA